MNICTISLHQAQFGCVKLNLDTDIWCCRAILSPSQRTHHSANGVVVIPQKSEEPAIRFPNWSCRKPPPPAIPGFPSTDPSVLSLNQPSLGGFQLTFEAAIRVKRFKFLLVQLGKTGGSAHTKKWN